MKDFLIKLVKHPFTITLMAAVVVSFVLLYATLKWLDGYTHHNQAVVVPDVKGLKMEEAVRFLEENGLRYAVIDSVFSNTVAPGAIVDIVPTVGSKVKEGRILFITVNAVTSQMAAVPDVEDQSFRQAYAILRSRGFESVEIEYVPGVYKDLAIGVSLRGRLLGKGEMVQLSAPLILKVSNGETGYPQDSLYDSIPPAELPAEAAPTSGNDIESWF